MSLAVLNKTFTPFMEFVGEYHEALRGYCHSICKSSWDAEDLMQETLLRAFKSWKQNPRALSKAYFIRIASNTWIDQHRKKTLPIEENQDVCELKDQDNKSHDYLHSFIQHVMKNLSSKQRVALLLIEGFGFTAAETADFIGLSEGAVKAALHRARKKLTQVQKDIAFDSEDEEVTPYINALNEGRPEHIVQLYRQEMGEPMMSLSTVGSTGHMGSMKRVMNHGGISYVLITITLKGGTQLTIPFFKMEWLVFLTSLEEGPEAYVLAA